MLQEPQARSLFMLLLESEVGTILAATDFGSLLCTKHCAYLSFILTGKYHHCPFYRCHLWGPERSRHLPHYVTIYRLGYLVYLTPKTGQLFIATHHRIPYMEDQGKQTQQTVVGPMAESDCSGEAAKEGGRRPASGVSARLLEVMWGLIHSNCP